MVKLLQSKKKKTRSVKSHLLGIITEVKDLIKEIISADGFSDAVSWIINSFTVEGLLTRYN